MLSALLHHLQRFADLRKSEAKMRLAIARHQAALERQDEITTKLLETRQELRRHTDQLKMCNMKLIEMNQELRDELKALPGKLLKPVWN